MNRQLPLLNDEDRVPATTEHSGKVINLGRTRWIVRTASDMETARAGAVHASVTGSVGAREYHYEVAGPEVMPEQRNIERWAIVDRIFPPIP